MRKTRILAAILSIIVLFTTVFTGDFVVNAEEENPYDTFGPSKEGESIVEVVLEGYERSSNVAFPLSFIGVAEEDKFDGGDRMKARVSGDSVTISWSADDSAKPLQICVKNGMVREDGTPDWLIYNVSDDQYSYTIMLDSNRDTYCVEVKYTSDEGGSDGNGYNDFWATAEFPYIVEYQWNNAGNVDRPAGIADENFITAGNKAKIRVANNVSNISFVLHPAQGEFVDGIRIEQEGTESNESGFVDLENDTRYNDESRTFTLDLTDNRYVTPDNNSVKFVYINFDFSGGNQGGNGYNDFWATEEFPYIVEYQWNNAGNVDRPAGIADENFITAGNKTKIRVANNVSNISFVLHPAQGERVDGIRIEQEGTESNESGFVDLENDTRYNDESRTFTLDLTDNRYVTSDDASVKFVYINFDFSGGNQGENPNPGGDDNIEVYFPGDVSISGNVITYQVDNKKVTLTVSGASVENNKIKIPRNNIDNVTFTVGENYDHDKMEVNLRDSQGFYLPLIVNEEGITKLTAFEGDHGIPDSFVLNIEDKHNDGPGPGPEPASDGIQFQVKGPDRGTVSYKIGDSSYTLANLDELQSSDQNSETYHFDEDTTVVFSVVPKNSTTEFSVHINCSDQNENVGQEMDKKYERGFMDQLAQGREVSFVAKAGMMYTITVEFGQQEMPWYTVSWAGGNVTVENGEVIAERVYIPAHDGEPAKVYTINVDEVDEAKGVYYLWDTIGKQKEKEEDPDSLELYGLGFSQSDLFIRNGLEGISIDFKFIPKYGYQLKDIYTNENHTEESCLNDFKTNDDNISTFTFDVRPGQNVHFQVYFKQSEDVISTEGATNISDAAIADGGNATSSGNLSLNVKDALKDSNVANAVSTFDVTLDNIVSKGGENGNWVSNITEFEDPITLTLDLDTTVYTSDSYTVVREHDGTYETLEATYDKATGELVFETNKFSTYTIVEKAYNVVGYQLVVDSNLDLKLTVDISDEIKADENSCIVFTVDGKEQRVKYSAIAGSYATYICEVPSKCIADTISAKLYFDGQYFELPEVSIKAYLEYLIKNPENIADYAYAKDIAEAILTYGAYSQIYFGYNTDKLANEKLATNPVEEITDENVKSAISISEKIVVNDDFGFLGASLVCNSDTFIRIYLINKNNLSLDEIKKKYDFYVAGGSNPVTDISVAGETVCLELQNIPAAELDNIYIFMLEGENTEVMIKYSPYNYISTAMDEGSENLKNLCKALYLYSVAANDYYNRYSVPA